MKNKYKGSVILTTLVISFSAFLLLTVMWLSAHFSDLTVNQIIFHLMVPMDGADQSFFRSAAITILLPTGLVAGLTWIGLRVLQKQTLVPQPAPIEVDSRRRFRLFPFKYRTMTVILNLTALLFTGLSVNTMDREFHLRDFVKQQSAESTFIAEHFQPSTDQLAFPEQKRNLIYLYLESMENTFSYEHEGGAFYANYIPELTEIAKTELSFSNTDRLGGSLHAPGTGWTMAAMFAHSTGLPFKIPVDENGMSQFASFFPGVEAIGDVLAANGYRNYLMIGSDAAFGGRKQFFTQHGDYQIMDYHWAIAEGRIPPDYKVWWGLEDQKLFAMAKEELTRIASGPEPFNFTMLTVDTHHENGYVCDLCEDDFPVQYANVLACSSRQTADFLSWIKTQDFYDNTTVVIVGDHRTMDSDFADDVPEDFERTQYNAFINVPFPADPERLTHRRFTAYDYYPTTLASLGVTIREDRLGLGTNLFSEEPTLLEIYGDEMLSELEMKSDFYNDRFIYGK